MKRMKKYSPRHSPAFVLLFLARGRNYGGAILKMMEEEIPCFLGDSSMIYRMLQDLESEGAVESNWEIPEKGRPVRYYQLTEKGWQMLLEAEEDIRKRIDNHLFFLAELKKQKAARANASEQPEKE
ncbi:MAG TPA: PadR family transcriptional regulator [Peptococcaceae bacterium]|nr:PadR family transcriptional regulator [Peptococcaceae bacterium]